jgi:hypothetical protein
MYRSDLNVQGHKRAAEAVEDKGVQASCGHMDHRMLNGRRTSSMYVNANEGRITDLIELAKVDCLANVFWLC